jgi:hypothetical protein
VSAVADAYVKGSLARAYAEQRDTAAALSETLNAVRVLVESSADDGLVRRSLRILLEQS